MERKIVTLNVEMLMAVPYSSQLLSTKQNIQIIFWRFGGFCVPKVIIEHVHAVPTPDFAGCIWVTT